MSAALRLTTPGWSNPALPVLAWRGVVPVGNADAAEAMLAARGWRPEWRDGVYPFHHQHSTAHEALACTSGGAELLLGGPDGERFGLAAGDLLLLPAGTGHCRVSASGDFLLVGAYPPGQRWDVLRKPADAAAQGRIAAVPLPQRLPADGEPPLQWRRA